MYDPIVEAQSIVPSLRATAPASEKQRKLADEAVLSLRDAGLSRLMAPRRYGGFEFTPREQILTNAITAQGCPAASWVQMVCAAHSFILGRFPERCQEEIFGDDPNALIPGTPAGQGSCAPADGGWVMNGRWQFCSGVEHGQWIMAGSTGIKDEAGKKTPNMLVVMRAEEVIIDDTWHVLGMRGTGSKDIVADNVFVPEHRAVPIVKAFLGTIADIDRALYRLPIPATLSAMGAGTILGITERGIDVFIEQTRIRQDIYVGGAKAHRAGLQMRIAEAKTEVELARSLVERNCDLLDTAMVDPAPMPVDARAQVRWNATYATQLCRRAADRIYSAAGAHATYDVNPLQSFFRDISTVSHHGVLDFDTVAEIQGKVLLNVEQNYAMV
ncbi:MAG: alkylation response protein AidB-like acyl-CoA dehydrogenase [Gammaproteobacteria bacterium]|jgi:alkylation response protein AidB-like acyl-CoA dehydrogenase